MPASHDDRVIASPNVVCTDGGNEVVLLALDTESYFGLDAVGTRFWALLTTSERIGDAVARLQQEFDAPADQIVRDVDDLVGELISRGLLRIRRD